MRYKFSILPDHFFFGCKSSDFKEDSYLEIEDLSDLESRINLKIALHESGNTKAIISIGKINKFLNARLFVTNSEINFGNGSCGHWDIRSWHGSKFFLRGNNIFSGGVKCILEHGSEVNIGEDCMFSDDVLIQCGSQHALICLEEKRQINTERSLINIQDHVWLGRGATVTTTSRLLEIGSGSIVGINSTLTRTIPETSLAVGYPAKVTRNNISWSNTFRANKKELDRIYSKFMEN